MEHKCKSSGEGMCSRHCTPESLTAMGFPVKQVQKVLGTPYTVVEGKSLPDARHDAWLAGKIRLCSRMS